jgi:hypothetical protein
MLNFTNINKILNNTLMMNIYNNLLTIIYNSRSFLAPTIFGLFSAFVFCWVTHIFFKEENHAKNISLEQQNIYLKSQVDDFEKQNYSLIQKNVDLEKTNIKLNKSVLKLESLMFQAIDNPYLSPFNSVKKK